MTAIDPNQPQAPQGPPTLPDGTLPVDPALVSNAILNALLQTARNAASSDKSGAEAQDYAQAVLNLSQAAVILDPALSQGGTPLAHDVTIKQIDGQNQATVAAIQAQAQVEVARHQSEASKSSQDAAAKPSPARSAVATA